MKLFDFLCSGCKDVFEEFGTQVGDTTDCPECGCEAKAILSGTRFKLPGYDPAYPTAWDQWARKHEQAARKAKKEDD